MFGGFFYLLRARGLDVSLGEWLTLVQAMDKGLAGTSFTRFYYLARSVLVKSEAEYDRFDGAFLEYFKDVAHASDNLPPELLNWLNNPDVPPHGEDPGPEREDMYPHWDDETIRKKFLERLDEQKEEHNGGAYWIGTGGMSPFGNSGHSPRGIRVGGESRRRLAMEVAGERKYRDFRDDAGLNVRSFQMALRKLRQFSSRVDAARTELNIDATVRATGDNCGRLELVFDKPRRNTVKLMLLIDSGGSMDPYGRLCSSLFQAVDRANHYKDLKVYYFHNCFKKRFYTTPAVDYRDSVGTDWILRNVDGEYKVIVVGDGLMNPSELTGSYYYYTRRGDEGGDGRAATGLDWLRTFRKHYRHMVWLTPEDNEPLAGSVWGASYGILKKEIDIKPLTMENLSATIRKLMVAR